MCKLAERPAGTDMEHVMEHFLSHYRNHGFKRIPGSSLLDPSVPMSFVMSAGLAQVESSAGRLGGRTGTRYALVQNCFRYFDMGQIGVSDTHLSLFHMPGAFAFGPLRKHETIAQIWDLLTNAYGLPEERLWATYFAGGEVVGRLFEPDLETQEAWLAAGLQPDHIVGLGPQHNFWKQGPGVVGLAHVPKCGPNTEVFFERDTRPRCGPSCQPGCGCGRFVEFQNTLFIALHMDDAGTVCPLDEPFAEIVVGAERVAMLLQGKGSVFEIDNIRPLVEQVRKGARASLPPAEQQRYERIVADHVRALLYLAADNAPSPGRGGRSRLVRKLVRGLLTGQRVLDIDTPAFLPSLVELAAELDSIQRGHLRAAREVLLQYIAEENERFELTLQQGFRRLDQLLQQRGGWLGGEDVIHLEKRQGIPLPLLKQRAQYDYPAYQAAYSEWRSREDEIAHKQIDRQGGRDGH